jgi:toxin ParE1/3/4
VPFPNPELESDLLFYRVEKHLIVCIRIQEGMAVLTVAHANRDIEACLGELTPTLRAELKGLVKKINAMK